MTFAKRFFLLLLFTLFVFDFTHAQTTQSIPNPNQPDDISLFSGGTAVVQPIIAEPIPQHPFMSQGEGNNIHNNAYMSDTYTYAGLIGQNLIVESADLDGICATITFDSRGHLISTCLDLDSATLYLLDAQTLGTLDQMVLPYRGISLLDLEFPPGSYFYLDEQERVILPVVGSEIWQIAIQGDETLFLENVIDLSQVLPTRDDINSVLPDFDGSLWFTTLGGIVGTVNTESNTIELLQLEGERISNSFAVDETGGVFIVTDTALYRLDADTDGRPTISWREAYDRGSRIKPGQVSQGSGTTPTVMGQDYVVITDNADPYMNVLVYQRAAEIIGDRLVCTVPVFAEDRSATENSVIATHQSIIIENNYGYEIFNPFAGLSESGMTRIDVIDGACEVIWTSNERIPSAVSKLSLGSGLIYTYLRNEAPFGRASWFLTAIDYVTGETVWKQYVGTGIDFNNNYSSVYLGSDGTAYVGVRGGIVSVRDSS